MDQSEISELISAYLDGEASPAEREEVERLLETSPHWRSKLDQFARLSELVRDVPRRVAPPELATVVRQRVDQLPKIQPAAAPARSLRREWLAALTGMAVTLLGGFITLRVMNLSLNRATNEHLASAQHDVMVLNEAASSRAKFRSEPAAPVSVSFAAPASPVLEAEGLAQENRQQSLNAEANGAALFGSMPAANAPAPNGPEYRYFDAQLSDVSAEAKPKDQLRIGDVFKVFEQMDGMVFVVELAVVDIKEAGGQLEVVLSKNGLNVLPDGAADDRSEGLGLAADKPEAKENAKDAASKGPPQLQMMYVMAPRVTISQVLDELGRQHVVSQARLQPPVANTSQTEAVEKLAEFAEVDGDQPATQEQVEAALLTEAVAVGQNYGMTQQFNAPVAEPAPQALALKQQPSNSKVTDQKSRSADIEWKKLRFSQANKKLKDDSGIAAADSSNLTRAPASQLSLTNCALPITLNPQTGEVTNLPWSVNSVRVLGKNSPRDSEVKSGPLAAKSRSLDDSVKADESAPADAASVAGTALGEQSAEQPIRVLFVFKQHAAAADAP